MEAVTVIKNGWLVQTTSTSDLIAAINIFPFFELKIGPLPEIISVSEMWPTVIERVDTNLVNRLEQADSEGKEQIKKLVTSPPVSGDCRIFAVAGELEAYLAAFLEQFGDKPEYARLRARAWAIESSHDRVLRKN